MNALPFLLRAPALLASVLFATAGETPLALHSGNHQIAFSPTNGSLVRLGDGGAKEPLFRSGEPGLWQVRFRDGQTLNASEFQAGANPKRFESRQEGDALLLTWQSPEISVVLRVTEHETGFDLQGQLTPSANTVLEFVLPARLRFDPARIKQFISPLHPHLGVGAAFNRQFFLPQPDDRPSGWRGTPGGPAGYRRLFHDGLEMRDLKEPAVNVQVTEDGKKWLGPKLVERLSKAPASVSRPSRRSQTDLVLLDSPNGPFFASSHLDGGTGALWRFGGQFEQRDQGLAVNAVEAVLRKLAAAPQARRRLALVSLTNGPGAGSGGNASVSQWRDTFQKLAESRQMEFVELRSPEAMMDAAAKGEFLAILNPYGEWLPVLEKSHLRDVVEAIDRYVRAGGHWFEVGGYPFYSAMRPSRFLSYESPYPPVFSDFLHLDAVNGRASLFGIQPRTWEPWSGAANPGNIFVPGRLAFAGDEQGGWCERAFGTFVPAGQTWKAPVVRLALGRTAEDDLAAYCQANAITRTLRDKLTPEVYSKLRQAVLVRYTGTAEEMLAALDQLPVPSLIHYAEYLKGGFDKEYPDHLPPHPRFGSPHALRDLHNKAHALGHLIMPYTNPTWWCDHPRGPSFEQAGEAALLRNLDGSLAHEQYSANDGWTTCFWHSAVRSANRKTVREFTEDYPVDILFQDQCGARRWRYDLNPASPTPFAYAEGLLSMVDEDSRTKPLSTEDGWDRVVNAEAQLCGFTFALGPGRRVPWAREMKAEYHPSTWELYPFVQRVAHDKAVLLHHDLGKFVTDRPTLSWTLGLGFALSYVVPARTLHENRHREWLRWLDRLQKSVCAAHAGEPVVAFAHQQGGPETGDDGVIRATYGPVQVICNLSPKARQEAGKNLAGYGFWASAPGMVAGNLQSLGGIHFGEEGISFVSQGGEKRAETWLFAAAGEEVAVELPSGISLAGRIVVTWDGQPGTAAEARQGIISFRLPEAKTKGDPAKRFWHATVTAP